MYIYIYIRALVLSYPIYQNLPQPNGTPLTPNINNLTPFANPHGTPMVKANKFLSSDWNLFIYYAYSSQQLRKYTKKTCSFKQSSAWHTKFMCYFHLTKLDMFDLIFLWLFEKVPAHANQLFHPLPNGTPLIGSTFFFHIIFLFVISGSSAQLPALSQISWFSARKPRLAQKQLQTKQQTKQTKQQQQQTKKQKAAESCRPLENLSKTAGSWLAAFNEVRTRCERGPNEVRNQN